MADSLISVWPWCIDSYNGQTVGWLVVGGTFSCAREDAQRKDAADEHIARDSTALVFWSALLSVNLLCLKSAMLKQERAVPFCTWASMTWKVCISLFPTVVYLLFLFSKALTQKITYIIIIINKYPSKIPDVAVHKQHSFCCPRFKWFGNLLKEKLITFL